MKNIKEKDIIIKLKYVPSSCDIEKGIFTGGPCEPDYMDELSIDIYDDYIFDFKKDDFVKTKYKNIDISGSNKALKSFGQYLINLALFQTEDDNYHDHFDGILNSNGETKFNIIVRKRLE